MCPHPIRPLRGRDVMTQDSNAIREAFRRHYETDDSHWGGHSGGGSLPYWNIEYRAFLERFIHLNHIRSIVDIGCGDWQFSRFLNFEGIEYRGLDVVASVVDRNRARFGSPNVTFELMPGDLSLLPSADLVIMKDVLQHLPDNNIMEFKDVLDRYPRALVSNSYRKLNTPTNVDIAPGDFRCLDLTKPPYNFSGNYVLEFSTPLFEEIRTLLYVPR